MAEVRMIKTGLTMGGQVRRQGEIVELTPPDMPLSIADQKERFSKGAWYVEVGSSEEETVLAVGLSTERDAFTVDKVIKPGFATPDETPEDVVTEQVPVQPTDEEMEAEMVGDSEAVVVDEEVEEDDDGLDNMSKKELRNIIENEDLTVKAYNTRTKKENLISRIRNAR